MIDSKDPDDALRALGHFVVDEAPLPELMTRIASTARDLIDAVTEASVTFANGDSNGWTVGTTGSLATKLDEAQYALGHGPCLDAATGGQMLMVRDFASDDRWPAYAPTALEAGVRSSLSVPFPIQHHVTAALNLYSTDPDSFSEGDVALAHEIASRAAVAVSNAVLYESASQLAVQLRTAMDSRATIEQAKGIIMATSHCSPDEAFEVLVRASQRENRKLRDIAADLVARNSKPPER